MRWLGRIPPRRALTTIVLVTLIIPVALLYGYLSLWAAVGAINFPPLLLPVGLGGWTLHCLLQLWRAADANDGRHVGRVTWIGIALGILHTAFWAVAFWAASPWLGLVCVLPIVAVLILYETYRRDASVEYCGDLAAPIAGPRRGA